MEKYHSDITAPMAMRLAKCLGLYKDEETKLLYAYIKTFIEFSLCLKYL
jgi:hypothetical protein